jgi:A/G-specific adenine glycosylase
VLSRFVGGHDFAARSAASVAEIAMAEALLPPAEGRRAATWSVALMELGALVCTAKRPACEICPLAQDCAWRLRGSPPNAAPRRAQGYDGTDRQCRGAVLAVLRAAPGPVRMTRLEGCWTDADQRLRVLAALIADGLAEEHGDGTIGLPGDSLDRMQPDRRSSRDVSGSRRDTGTPRH